MFRPSLRVLRAVFWAAVLVAFVVAVWPRPLTVEVANIDKAFHFTTFYGLQLLALLAFPRTRLAPVLGLVGYGALIEVVQVFTGRDMDIFDWLADSLGVAAALAPFVAARLQGRARV